MLLLGIVLNNPPGLQNNNHTSEGTYVHLLRHNLDTHYTQSHRIYGGHFVSGVCWKAEAL